jgi:uncharacterized protein (TIGR02453 family)
MISIFTGFGKKTSEFFFLMTLNNNKAFLNENIDTYNTCVKYPLQLLHSELTTAISEIDSDICVIPRRCISGIYNDMRFGNRDTPLRNYMWIRFKCMCNRDTDIPGFFFDASYDNYRYGLRIYNMTTAGMKKIRDAILNDTKNFIKLIKKLDSDKVFEISGNEYAKDHYPQYDPTLKNWLNRRDLFIHNTKNINNAYYSNELVEELAAGFQKLAGIYEFLINALLKGE